MPDCVKFLLDPSSIHGVPKDGADHVFAPYRSGPFRLAGIKDHKRRYEAK